MESWLWGRKRYGNRVTSIEPQPTSPPPRPRFQFGLRTLLLLFVVLGSSLVVFGAWGVVVFGVVVGLAIGWPEAQWCGFSFVATSK